MKVNISQANWLIVEYIRAGLVPMLVGSPGCGKSDLFRQIAEAFNLLFIDMRLAQCDPSDINGFPHIFGKKAGYLPMDTFPLEGDPIPEGYSGWLLFFDEFNSASPAVQSASYKIILDRMVGQYKLHPKCALAAAGNLETDNAIVNPLSTAMQSRLAHMELVFEVKPWMEWWAGKGFDSRIESYMSFKPSHGFTFSPDHTDCTFACPRTWEFTNRLLQRIDINDKNALPAIAGVVTEGVARDFLSYCQIHDSLPKISEIMNNPDSIKVPTEPGPMWATMGSLADNASVHNINPIVKYLNRFPKEFQVMSIRSMVRRSPTLLKTEEIDQWMKVNAEALF